MAYAALVPSTSLGVKAADDAADARWFPVAGLPQPLAFDHKEVVRAAFGRLKQQPQVASNGEAFLPPCPPLGYCDNPSHELVCFRSRADDEG